MSLRMAIQNGNRYWEKERPREYVIGRNVFKCFRQAGKIQVFPRVPSARNGIGRGASIDLEHMNSKERSQLVHMLTEEITAYKSS